MWKSCIELNVSYENEDFLKCENLNANSSSLNGTKVGDIASTDQNHNHNQINLNQISSKLDSSHCDENSSSSSVACNKNLLNLNSNINKSFDSSTAKSNWDLLCQLINCKETFKKQCNGRKYNWIQIAGHSGKFKPGEREGYILKLMDPSEYNCLSLLQTDLLSRFVPRIDSFHKDENDGQIYIELQDLLYGFQNPSIMDIKIGVRTFLEDEYMDEKESKPRKDLFQKMYEIDPEAFTESERETQAITKRRFMTWREVSTSSRTLGFRIEAIKKTQVLVKELFKLRERKDVKNEFKKFTETNSSILKMYIDRLIDLRETLIKSEFFKTHEMIGSSLLFVHDSKKATIGIIDFGKTRTLPNHIQINHKSEWIDGNHEDGYLIGIDNLIEIFEEIAQAST